MRIATISALFPPTVIGGAEVSASNLASHLARRGHTVRVLSTTTQSEQKVVQEELFNKALLVRRYPMPRTYTAVNFAKHSVAAKLVWHAQDHLDPRNRKIWGDFLDKFKPDLALVHVAQGLGYNGLLELGTRDIPTIFILHDLSLACYKTSMFKNGHTCAKQCGACKLSSKIKHGYIQRIPRHGFVSPSRSNLETVTRNVPISGQPSRVILNANPYPRLSLEGNESSTLRLIYAGQISRTKGVEFLLKVVDDLVSRQYDVSLRVVGGGPELERLQATYADRPWATFTGKVTQEEVSRFMAKSDVLCAPSIWADNSPGVIIQAMTIGLPVVGSEIGGIPELIQQDATGAVLPAGDEAAWSSTIAELVGDRARLRRWTQISLNASARFDPDASVNSYLEFADEVRDQKQRCPT